MKTSQAGTLESMDCLVTLTEAESGAGIKITITGASAARFKSAMEKKITETLEELGVKTYDSAFPRIGGGDPYCVKNPVNQCHFSPHRRG